MHTRPRTSGSGCHDPPRGARLLGGRLPGAAHGNSPEQRVLRERSGVYWKPKGAAAKRAGPKQRVLRSLRATQGDLVCMYQHKKQPGCAVRGFLLLVSRKDKGFDSAKTLRDHRVLPSRLQVPAQLITVHRGAELVEVRRVCLLEAHACPPGGRLLSRNCCQQGLVGRGFGDTMV